MMKPSLFKGIAGPDNALRGPKCISLLGPDLSLHTGHWVLTSFRTKLVSTSSEGPGSIMVPSIQWALRRHTLTSSLSVWGWPCLSHPKLVAALCRGLKRLSQGIMGHYLVQVSKECRAKKICPWPNRAWEEFFFSISESNISCGSQDCLWLLTSTKYIKTEGSLAWVGIAWCEPPRRRHLGHVKYKCIVCLCQ